MARLNLSFPWLKNTVFYMLVLVTGASLAYAYIVFSRPVPVVAPPLMAPIVQALGVDRAPEARLLGVDNSGNAVPPNVQLLGVAAGDQGHGSAVLTLDGQSAIARRSGDMIANGWVLGEVNGQGIVLTRDNQRHPIALPARSSIQGMISADHAVSQTPYAPQVANPSSTQPDRGTALAAGSRSLGGVQALKK